LSEVASMLATRKVVCGESRSEPKGPHPCNRPPRLPAR
jgi:hypothetical protein